MKTELLLLATILGLVPGGHAAGQDTQSALERSASRATVNQQYDLRYKLTTGESIRWSVEQIASTETRMAGHEEKSSLRSRSVHSWTVDRVDSLGNMTFQNRLESAAEWQKIGDEPPVSYDSSQDEEVPDIYRATAEKIGKPIATITIDPHGQVIERIDHITTAELGMGAVTLPLPGRPVSIGDDWEVPEELQARHKDKSLKPIKTRVRYTLRDVTDGIATISFRREILTPVDEPWIQMQLQQKINQGSVHFDIATGRIIRRLVQWDEKVQGFEGSDSFLRYLGNYTMTLLPPEDHQAGTLSGSGQAGGQEEATDPGQTATPGPRSSSYVKPRDAAPIIRR